MVRIHTTLQTIQLYVVAGDSRHDHKGVVIASHFYYKNCIIVVNV